MIGNHISLEILNFGACLGDYRDARTLIGREVHHISL